MAALRSEGEEAFVMGEVRPGGRGCDVLSPVRVAVLVSGGGSNLQALLDAQAAGRLRSGRVALVISDRPDAYALERARARG